MMTPEELREYLKTNNNALEQAIAIRQSFSVSSSCRVIGDAIGKDASWVHKRLRILEVPEEVQQLVSARRVTLLDLEIVRKQRTPESQIDVAKALADSKRGRGRTAVFVGEKLTRSFRRRRNKSESNSMIKRLVGMNSPTSLLMAKVVSWCAGYASDDEIEKVLNEELVVS